MKEDDWRGMCKEMTHETGSKIKSELVSANYPTKTFDSPFSSSIRFNTITQSHRITKIDYLNNSKNKICYKLFSVRLTYFPVK